MINFRKLLILIIFILPVYSLADGVPGCDGGTDPASDGRFYTPDGIRCNPGPEDAQKSPVTNQGTLKATQAIIP